MTQYLIQCCTRGRFSITTYQLGKWHSHTHLIYPPSLVVRSRTEGSESDSSWHCPGNQHTAWHQGSKEICAITRGPRQATDTEFQSRPVAGGGVPPPPRFANPRMRQRNGDAAQREQRTEALLSAGSRKRFTELWTWRLCSRDLAEAASRTQLYPCDLESDTQPDSDSEFQALE